MAKLYGEGMRARDIIKKNLKVMYFQFFILVLIAAFVIVLLPFVIPVLLPQYSEGVRAAQWIALLPVISSFTALNQIFNVTKKQKIFIVTLITGALFGTAFVLICIGVKGFDIVFFPQGLLFGVFIQQMLSLFFAFRIK